MQERSLINKIARNHRKIGHTQHRRVESHAVPRHLGMRGRGATKRSCGECGTAILLDEDRGVIGENIAQREGNVITQGGGVDKALLHTQLSYRAMSHHTDLLDVNRIGGVLCREIRSTKYEEYAEKVAHFLIQKP